MQILFQQTRIYPSQENEWLWRYLQDQHCAHNKLYSSGPVSNQECIHNIDKIEPEDDLHIALRTEDVLTASQAVGLMAQAFLLAWEVLCFNGNRQPCPELMKMSHQDFQQSYFIKVLQNQRSGLKLPLQNNDWLKEPGPFPNLLLVEYLRNRQHKSTIDLHKVSKINYYTLFYVSY